MNILFATHNLHKAREVNDIIGRSFQVLTLNDIDFRDEITENGNSFADNAMIKANAGFIENGIPCFADDSGLEVMALGGAPGIHSARYAGEPKDDQKNIELLLRNMSEKVDRRARFVTVLCFINHAGTHFFEGVCEGTIIHHPRGKDGFGYDPIFIPNGHKKTFAEIDPSEKNRISHRGQAMEKFKTFLRQK
ncbi:MAG: RdgB/HAM1 family non-canonical purine NTP pyrophosphatase [Flavobacteriales bacterium]